MNFVESISATSCSKISKFAIESDGNYAIEPSFACKMVSILDQTFQFKLDGSTFIIDSLNERIEFDFEETLLEQIESIKVEDQLFVFCMSTRGTIFRILVDWESIGLNSVDRIDSTLFQYGISPIRFHCSDVEAILVSLTNGQLYSLQIAIDGQSIGNVVELKDSSYVGQIRSIMSTPVKFINAIRNSNKSRLTGLEDQALGMTSFHYEKIHVDFILTRNGRLSIWNSLSQTCLKSISLESILVNYQFSDLSEVFTVSPSKVIEVYHYYSSQTGMAGQCIVHLPFSYQPLFVSMDFKVDFSLMNLDVSFDSYIACKSDLGQLLDFVIVPKESLEGRMEQFMLWTLWEGKEAPLAVCNVDLKTSSSRWFSCQSALPLAAPVIEQNVGESLDRVYMDYIFSPGQFPLETIAQCADYPPSNVISITDLYEHVLNHVSSKVKANDDSVTLAEAWHRFVSQLVEIHNAQLESFALFHDSMYNRIVVLKYGEAVGYVRSTDAIELISSPEELLAFAKDSEFSDHLQCLKSLKLRNGISHLKALTDYVANDMVSIPFMEEVTVDMLSSAKELGIDDFAIQVFDRIKEHYIDNESDWLEHLRIVELLVAKVDSLDYLLSGLLTCFQHHSTPSTEEPNMNESLSGYIATSLRTIIEKRYQFIQNVFFVLILIKHLDIPISFTRKSFVGWYSIYSCYVRLLWLSKQVFIPRPTAELGLERLSIAEEPKKPASVLEFLIHRHIHLELHAQDWAEQIMEACLGVIGQLGWSVVHPVGSIDESTAVIRWAYILFNDIPAFSVLELLEMIPSQSPAYAVLIGRVWMELNEIEKAKYFLAKGASGVGNAEADLALVLPESVLRQGLVGYYEHIMNCCLEKQVLELAIYFGKLASLHVRDPTHRIDLLKQVFNVALNYEDFDSAYEILLLMNDPDQQKFCLGSLVGQLCETRSLELLCIRFKFAGMSKEVEEALLFKARTEVAKVGSSTAYHHICYTYFTYRYDFRIAAMVMFNHGRKLSELPFSSKYSLEEKKSVFTRMSQCFLTALNALALLDPERAYFTAPKAQRNAFETQDGFESDLDIVDIEQVRKCYYLAIAKLTLFSHNAQLGQSFSLPDPEDVYTIYAINFQFDHAIQIASLYQFRLDKVITNCIKAIVQIMNHRPCTFSYKEEAHKAGGNLLSQAWLTLQMILKDHDSAKELYPYHQQSIKSLLETNSTIFLPKWLIEPFTNELADILLRLYIKHSRLQEALKLALGILERARTQPAHRHNSRWIPAHVLDILLETLKQNKMDKESASLVTAFGEYQAELQIVSK